MPKAISELPLELAEVTRANLLAALDSVRGCLKTASMLWMRTLGLPVLDGVVVADWSQTSANAVRKFCKRGKFSELLLRIDKRNDRWTRRRGGYLISLGRLPTTVRELRREGMVAVLLEPASPYADRYSLAGATIPDQERMIIEVVGPGFDASDILRGDLEPHERWEADLRRAPAGSNGPISLGQTRLTGSDEYSQSVQRRLAKIGARVKNPAFPETLLQANGPDSVQLVKEGAAFLKSTRQTTLLKHAETYVAIPQRHLMHFANDVKRLLSGLSDYGIYLGPSSFAASVIPKRGLVFWDFFPARKQEAALLYPAA